jgi:hypothetical protein
VYEHERISLHVPKKFHDTIKPYLEEDLGLKVATEKSLILILTPAKKLRHAANNPARHNSKPHTAITAALLQFQLNRPKNSMTDLLICCHNLSPEEEQRAKNFPKQMKQP